jgi:hypothetical protein
MTRENMTGEFRTIDSEGMLVRIVEYTAAGSVTAGAWLTRYYKTEDGETCNQVDDDGIFIEASTGRVLTRIR